MNSMNQNQQNFQQSSMPPEVDRRMWLTRRLESPEAIFFWRRYKHTITYMIIALLLAISIATVGFGYTLLGVIFLTIAYFLGGWRDGNPIVYQILNRFL